MGGDMSKQRQLWKRRSVRNEGRGDLIEETMQHSVRERRPKTVTCTWKAEKKMKFLLLVLHLFIKI